MEKKEYIKPSVEVIEVAPVSMMATSTPEIGFGEEEKDASGSWSNKRRGKWGDLWADNESK